MHLFGLRDWYEKAKDREAVGPNNMINNSNSKKPIMHQIHWNNWKNIIEQKRNKKGGNNNFTLNRFAETD